ncbi:MAG: Fe-S cluster domain-containing protein [Bacteroidales bacterium]|nr:Fe-S cluster domain-containing protein [Bacteroidales bacterium]
MELVIYTVVVLCVLAAIMAIILYFVAQKFKVYEDPRIDEVEGLLAGANCGGCGFPGCRGFAEALVKADSLDSLYCPATSVETMGQIADMLGKAAVQKEPMIAVVRCSGSFENRPKTNVYNGIKSCAAATMLYSGDTGCPNGCLGLGDCVAVCNFDAIHIDQNTGLPVVSDENCTACGACITACPKNIIELRFKGKKDRRIFVSCVNTERGGVARKTCSVACIGCGACVRACPFDAITLENNLAYIDFEKCKLCRKCVEVCPTNSIHELNFPPRKPKQTEEKTNEKQN